MNAIDAYLADLGSRLNVGRRRHTMLLDEVRDHLIESTDRRVPDATSADDRHRAELEAVNAFGPPATVARQFNAAAGAQAMRVAPVVAFLTGAGVVGGFLSAAVHQPRTTQSATLAMQISFFLAVLAFQIAAVAGACAASRAAATWRTSAASGRDRALVYRCSVVSILALAGGVLAMTTNFVLDARQAIHADTAALAVGGAAMVAAVAVGLIAASRLEVNAAACDAHAGVIPTPAVFRIGDSIVGVVLRYPTVSCVVAAIGAAIWTMAHAEEPSVAAALPWGVAEAATVVAAFLLIGPALGLRSAPPTADPS